MGLFSRKPKSPLPANLAEVLAEWGRAFPPPGVAKGDVSQSTDAFVHSLIFLDAEQLREAVAGIRESGLREGGWTAYGAWELLNMTYVREVPREVLDELSEPRVRLIHSLGLPGFPGALCVDDAMAWKRVFQDDGP
jgi:hypothetical protein